MFHVAMVVNQFLMQSNAIYLYRDLLTGVA
jgi:hypothetical protein